MTPYYTDTAVTLWHGDCREVLPSLDLRPDCVVTDPPYGETSLAWDRWPDGWPEVVGRYAASMWCFGSMRMFLDRRDEYAGWKLSQDVVWQKQNGTGLAADRFRRVHEYALHWYRGDWGGIYHQAPREAHYGPDEGSRTKGASKGAHLGAAGERIWTDDGTRLMRSVLRVSNLWRRTGSHKTEKPTGILDPLIRYACPPGGLVLDVFAGSGSTAAACRLSGRRAVLIEADEAFCERIVTRLQQDVLPIEVAP